jgi:PE family
MATEQPIVAAVAGAVATTGIGTELSTVPQMQNITVSKDNVLQAARIIQDALDNEGQQIRSNLPMLHVIAPGADQISVAAAQAWNDRLSGNADSYSVRVEQYLQSLQVLVDNLVTSARQYGYSDQQISDAFRPSGA